eukprot:CAMPEP_0119292352 /NCGR_PEP_ID=MMETSP1329-20130426/44002_1 /TAXON_ID=114041 /ORGANISM="Genus nov. species nov., Strain RCC1024" /LENGTH=187 /DNA_ID=CAMNT_0007293189 /DNA_START=142 /DNA_END=702 /DNA_ORIENTATION=+
MPPTKRKCAACTAAGLENCKHCICPGCSWCMQKIEAMSCPDVGSPSSPLAALAHLSSNNGAHVCGALREAGGSVRCRSCRRHNVKAKKKSEGQGGVAGSGSGRAVKPRQTSARQRAAAEAKAMKPAPLDGGYSAPRRPPAVPRPGEQGCYFASGADPNALKPPPIALCGGAAAWPGAEESPPAALSP